MSDKGTSEIVGREGLAGTVAAVAQQVSAVEKASTAGFASLREVLEGALASMRDEGVAWRLAHDNIHIMEQKALNTALTVMEEWKRNSNEWRAESQQRQLTYMTKDEMNQVISRLEAKVDRNSEDINKQEKALVETMKPVTAYITSSSATAGTLRTLMVVILFALTVVGFLIGFR